MTERAAKSMAPYKIQKRGGKFAVVNNAGETKASFKDRAAALAYQRALYANAPGAAKQADKKPWTGKQKRAATVKAGLDDTPEAVASAMDALLDAFGNYLDGLPPAALTPELKQARALLAAAEIVGDELLEALGLQDPDDPEDDMATEDAADVTHKPGAPSKKAGQHFTAGSPHLFAPGKGGVCAVCGKAAGGDHLAAAKAAQDRVRELRKRHAARTSEELAARLQKNYGPRVDAVGTLPSETPVGPTTGPTPREVENKLIAENAKTPQAQGPHPFMAAEFPDDNGDPRCRLCGEGADPHAHFQPQIPVAAAQTSVGSSLTLTWNGGYTDGAPTISSSTGNWTLSERPSAVSTPVVSEGARVQPPETAKAFLTEVDGRTLITAPANVFVREVEKAAGANEHMLWMQGRFVGAEKANRNGAFWSTKDLELGQVTVPHGPLNWLHEARHVIGTIAKAQVVTRDEETASELDQPYIEAASAIWRWIYPDEAWVVEQASDAGKLWYSMECVSKEVACVGAAGCGARASYGQYLKGAGETCEHMRQRSATRHFSDPTFLGGAVIVPPVRPGWAEADASVIRQAASLAEDTFEQAGRPDVAASEWEQLMAQVVGYASNR